MVDGILVVNKPVGMTSFDVVARLRRHLGQKKIGHAGTLDPSVDGILVLALGKATKLIDVLQSRPKTYQGEITLGFQTETEDREGTIIKEQALTIPLSVNDIDQAIAHFHGQITQVPPLYSAVKVAGRRLYEYARANEPVERPARSAYIYDFKRTSQPEFDGRYQSFDFQAQVSKGTYIRTLASDVGEFLNLPATMTRLTRISGSGFDLSQATSLDGLLALSVDQIVERMVVPINQILDWPIKELDQTEWFAVSNGQKISDWPINESGYLQLYYQGQLKAVYQYNSEQALWRSRYVFSNR
ncbi:tRNA pseudouridine(55) synthase TruB [Convivina praedatoris]|uniref:tRNA pseudouridine synthase B n=2 Tax=Convivina praedatoris TaxID=2880963 RepID=A0ABN8H9J0_9LACO|nr:tRNA pseudouridine(55) synthase TruB [Convivina sp. LMG 32447]CAH1853538.1 tRNA pseudouridine synthase B [Convivina sp. LMG 32447]CAH1854822.1 tRNA pseudouridine synthase B [Convivina sp. LMG 32447]CAH1854989.1 tRNA pseudouridine synthase B [Convivina sp. LMG 32447]